MSEIESKRSAGFLDNASLRQLLKAVGLKDYIELEALLFHVHVLMLLQFGVSPSKGTLPVSISYKTTPKE